MAQVIYKEEVLPEPWARIWLCLNLRSAGSTSDDLCWQTEMLPVIMAAYLQEMQQAGLIMQDGKRWKLIDSGAKIIGSSKHQYSKASR